MKPKITTVITTYYRPDLLARAMRSVQLQTLKEFECIVFSDHCPAARKVYEEYFSDDSRFVFVDNPNDWVKNVGATGHNYALDNASSEIITYLCDDNIYLPNHLETVYNNISDDIGTVITKGFQLIIGSGRGSIEKLISRDFNSDFNSLSGYSLCPLDLISVGHKIQGSPYWSPWCECGTNNEDGVFLKTLLNPPVFKSVEVPDITGFYYARGASITRDESYHEAVSKLKDEEIFVYPELTERIFDENVIYEKRNI